MQRPEVATETAVEECKQAEKEGAADKGAMCTYRSRQALSKAKEAAAIAFEIQTIATETAQKASISHCYYACVAGQSTAKHYREVSCNLYRNSSPCEQSHEASALQARNLQQCCMHML